MRWWPRWLRRPRRDDRGTVSLFSLLLVLPMFAVAGLVVDGGLKMRAAREATGLAQEAARAGMDRIDLVTLRNSGAVTFSYPEASDAALEYLDASGKTPANGYTADVTPDGVDGIRVVVHVHQATTLLRLIGLNDWDVSGSAVAHLETG
jgi:Flp pilus assembly protein TadG